MHMYARDLATWGGGVEAAAFLSTSMITRAVLSPGNRTKPCKFQYVKSVRNFM